MKNGKAASFGLAVLVGSVGKANAHVLDHVHTHTELSMGLVLMLGVMAACWMLTKNRKD